MNAYKLNGRAGHFFRSVICKHLGIHFTDIYKTVEDVYSTEEFPCIIMTKDGKMYKLVLEEI